VLLGPVLLEPAPLAQVQAERAQPEQEVLVPEPKP
jgi:hypothetical protein